MWTPLRTDCWVADTVGVGQRCGSDEAPVTWWRGPGRGGARMVQLERGVFILPSCAFSHCDEEGGFARRFLWKI